MGKVIERDDLRKIREMAKKYNMDVSTFGRTIVRQVTRSLAWQIRVTDEEYNFISQAAEDKNISMSKYFAIAVHAFLGVEQEETPTWNRSMTGPQRKRRIEVRLQNDEDEVEIVRLAAKYSIPVSALLRYCALNFDGENIIH